MIETPGDVIQELLAIRSESERGLKLLGVTEKRLIEAVTAADRAEASALLEAQGTVADRQAVALLKSETERHAAELVRAELNYIKAKLKHLSESMMAVQTSARMVELQWKTSGIER
jgi:hypothetical protein